MHVSVLLLAMGSSVGWAGLDTCRKLLARRMQPIPIVVYLTLGQIPLFTAWLLIEGQYRITPGYLWPASLSVLLNTIANLMFVRAVQVSPLSLTIPFLSLTPVLTTLMGLLILDEVPSLRQFGGILLVVYGAFSLHAGGPGVGHFRRMWRAFRSERGSVLMTGVALLWAINAPLDKIATARSSVAVHALVLCATIALGLLLVLTLRQRLADLKAVKGQMLPLLGAIGFGTAGLGLQLMAFQWLFVALVDVIKRVIGLIAAVVLGHLLFAEAITTQKLRAIGLISVGIALVLL